MKKKLESELISIAHRILKLKGKEDVYRMHTEVAELYEKLSVFKFAQENFEDHMPTIGNNSSFFEMLDTAFNNKVTDTIEVEDKVYINVDEVEDDGIMEPVMETIKDMVAQMPDESEAIDQLVDDINTNNKTEIIFEDISADFESFPEFEAVNNKSQSAESVPKAAQDVLNNTALQTNPEQKSDFIKHLFNGKQEDFERVISQLNTTTSLEEAQDFIHNLVKPDYNNWEGKNAYESQFMEMLANKFN